jgi:23S rRNA pseudouridine1911/1915/1917 synthase
MIISSQVTHVLKDCSLIDYLTVHFTYLSRLQWLQKLEENRFAVNDNLQSDPDFRLCRGDVIAYDMPEFQEPPADLNFKIIYEDDYIIGVDKPGNLLVHRSGKSFRSNLIYQLRYCRDPVRYGDVDIINRLDRETSGVVLLAKDKNSLRMMNDAFALRAMRKEYIAIVAGTPREEAWTVKLPIGKDIASAIKYKYCIDHEHGKEAETYIETVQKLSGHAMVRLKPITGRTHQIRVHLAAAGLPIVGDKLYGMEEKEFLSWRDDTGHFKGQLLFHRQALHCACISFVHPITKNEISIAAPLPRDLKELVGKLQKLWNKTEI